MEKLLVNRTGFVPTLQVTPFYTMETTKHGVKNPEENLNPDSIWPSNLQTEQKNLCKKGQELLICPRLSGIRRCNFWPRVDVAFVFFATLLELSVQIGNMPSHILNKNLKCLIPLIKKIGNWMLFSKSWLEFWHLIWCCYWKILLHNIFSRIFSHLGLGWLQITLGKLKGFLIENAF